ncbi:hypothetical protein [Catellatospora coxensis]|uniref:hypothetical protein n=1 Tax=Catellatospora coxensis TaxID=310354 RepID=UPI0031D9B29E
MVITSDDGGWHAEGRFLAFSETALEGVTFLCDLDPVFDLRFEDGGTIPVTVHLIDERGRFALTAPTGLSGTIDYQLDLTTGSGRRSEVRGAVE